MIKSIQDFPNVQIVCRNTQQVKDCANYLKKLGYDFAGHIDNTEDIIILINNDSKKFFSKSQVSKNLYVEFYNKELVKTLQKFIKQKEEKEKIKDIEVASDGRITKINNRDSQQKVYIIYGAEAEICNLGAMDKMINFGLLYATKEARDKAMFKLEIETKLKNIAERLNNGRKIDWEDKKQEKYYIYYDYDDKKLEWFIKCYRKDQGTIYCLDENFSEIAKQEIGEENLIKYFKE